MTRKIYQVFKHGKPVNRLDNTGPEFNLTKEDNLFLSNYVFRALLTDSEQNILWHVAKSANGDIANLGHSRGGSAIVMGAALKYEKKPYTIHSVDAIHSDGKYAARMRDLNALDMDNVILHRGFTAEVGEKWVKEGKHFYFTFIDAGHDYESVKQDWLLFSTISDIVAFHDTNQLETDDIINEFVLPSWSLLHHVGNIKVFKK